MRLGDYNGFAQVGGTHQAHSYSATGNIQTYDQPGFTTYDASLGAEKDAWIVTLYMANLTNTRADLFENGNQFVTAETINRPRTGGLKVQLQVQISRCIIISPAIHGARERRLVGVEHAGDVQGSRRPSAPKFMLVT